MNTGFQYAMGGIRNLSQLADLEEDRRERAWRQQVLQSRAQAEAIGGLAGSVIGAGAGIYQDRKEQHDDAERERVREWEAQRQRQRWENARQGREMDAGVTAPPKVNPYSALDDIHQAFRDLGWVD